MQIYLKTLGCRLNEAELETWAEGFQKRGHALTTCADTADMLIINTCAVTQEAVKKSRQIIRRTQRNNPKAKLVISGCYASLDQRLQDDIPGIDLIVKNQHKDKLVDIALRELNYETMPATSTEPGVAGIFKRGRNRAFIKIQDGCRYRCRFCIVTVARGDERSKSPEQIIRQINQFHQQEIQEVVLTGVHLGGYGNDIDSNLYQLIKTILDETGIPRIRFGSLEPWALKDNFFSLFANNRLMPHLHLPLQSGSNSVLRRMARRCKKNDFKHIMQQAKNYIPDLNVTTDIIVGFPGETDEEWRESLNFIEEIGFSKLHIFSYSKRNGTKAATLPNALSPAVKKARSRELHLLEKSLRRAFLRSQIKKNYSVLWETLNNHNRWSGYTDNFIRVELEQTEPASLENKISTVSITSLDDDAEYCFVKKIEPLQANSFNPS